MTFTEYDAANDIGYIDVGPKLGAKSVAFTIPVSVRFVGEKRGQINIDIGHDGRVTGFEIIDISQIWPADLIPKS